MYKQFNKEWIDWINLNIARGCDKNGVYKILIDEGFDPDEIEKHMKYSPDIDINTMVNPLTNNPQAKQKKQPESFMQWLVNFFSGKKKEIPFAGVLPSTQIFIPKAERVNSELAEMYLLPNFLTRTECEKITDTIKSKLRPSTIANKDEPDEKFRTSSTCDLGIIDDIFIEEIDQRICKTLGINVAYSEIMQGQYYTENQEFKSHTDYFEGDAFEEFASDEGQRTYTFMVYLNDVDEGGETDFVKLDKKIQPQQGMAVVWNNLNPDGSINPNTMHHAHPVVSGHKSIITKWFRSRGEGQMHTKTEGELLPNLTNKGFKKEVLDQSLFAKIQQFYNENQDKAETEVVEGFIHNSEDDEPVSTLVELDEQLKNEIHSHLKPLLEEWSSIELEATYVYGIRVYGEDAILEEHRDRETTHIVSAIINVDQNVDVDWPLVIEDHHYRKHNINLSPGEVMFYEGARLQHGRPQPLQGKEYANIFCHFKVSGA